MCVVCVSVGGSGMIEQSVVQKLCAHLSTSPSPPPPLSSISQMQTGLQYRLLICAPPPSLCQDFIVRAIQLAQRVRGCGHTMRKGTRGCGPNRHQSRGWGLKKGFTPSLDTYLFIPITTDCCHENLHAQACIQTHVAMVTVWCVVGTWLPYKTR